MTSTSHSTGMSGQLIRLASVAVCLATVVALPMIVQRADAKVTPRWDDPVIAKAVTISDDRFIEMASPEQAARLQRIEKAARAWSYSWAAAAQD